MQTSNLRPSPQRPACNTAAPILHASSWQAARNRLESILENNALCLFVQPIRSLHGDGRYPMAEVLVRLREEETLLLSPGDFLPVFEHFCMMPLLDRWVVRQSVALLAARHPDCAYERLTINVSAQSLADPAFPRFICDTLEHASVSGGRLGLEPDEDHMYRYADLALRFCQSVRDIGTPILIDGFGHHSVRFGTAMRLQAGILKIDGRVIRQLASNKLARQKMQVITALARKHGIPMLAESVEDLGILPMLRDAGVIFAQGFGISHPKPAPQPHPECRVELSSQTHGSNTTTPAGCIATASFDALLGAS